MINRWVGGDYTTFSIEEMLMLEFKYIAKCGDNEEVIDV